MKLLLSTNLPSPYMVEYLDILGRSCELTALFELSAATDREKSWYKSVSQRSFTPVFLDAVRIGTESGLSFKILRYLTDESFDRVIIADPTTPTGIVALLYCRWFKKPHIIQSEGGFQGSGRGPKEKFKKYLMENAALYLTGMGGKENYFLRYGATEDRMRRFPFTSLRQSQIDTAPIEPGEKQTLREKLGVTEKLAVISVGSPQHRKGFDLLLKACAQLPMDAGLYIVGAGMTDEYEAIIKEKGLKHVHFIAHCGYNELSMYYHACDIFVLATRRDTWGLVINEAMANGLPVITTDMCVAGKQLIENGVNGYLVPSESVDELARAMSLLLSDEELRGQMSRNNLEKIQPYSLENMARTIYQALLKG